MFCDFKNAAKGSLVVVIYDELLDQLVAVLIRLSRLTDTLKQRQYLLGFHVGLGRHCSRRLLDDLGTRKLGGLFGIICVHHPAARRLGIHNDVGQIVCRIFQAISSSAKGRSLGIDLAHNIACKGQQSRKLAQARLTLEAKKKRCGCQG